MAPTAVTLPAGLPPLPSQTERHDGCWKTVLRVRARQASPCCLPQFWRDFKPCREGSARGLVESYRDQNYPTRRPKYAFLLSPQLIKDSQTVDFIEGDHLITFENRHKGLSTFSLAPLEEFRDECSMRG
jgi:hypothetical protein